MNKKIISGLAALLLCYTSCGGSTLTDDSSTTASISTIDELPRASDAVSAASASLNYLSGPQYLATDGLTLSELDDTDFNSDSSMAMCLTSSATRQAFKNASFADMVMCYVQETIGALDSVDIYDGDEHTFRLSAVNDPHVEEGDESMTLLIKTQVVRNSDDVITDFKMWACEGGSQTDYMHYSIDDQLTITTEKQNSGDDYTGSETVVVSGDIASISDEIVFTSKSLVAEFTSTQESEQWGEQSQYGQVTFQQEADSLSLTSYESGSFTAGESENSFTNSYIAIAQLLNPDSMSQIAIGTGAAQYLVSGTWDGGAYEETGTESWDGDSTEPVESNEFTDEVAASDLPDAIEPPSIEFTDTEIFDCDDTNAIDVSLDFASESVSACNEIATLDTSEYLDCYGTIQQDGGE